GGLGVLIDALAERSKAEVRTLSPVTGLHPEGGGWALEVGAPGAAEPERLHADAVVLACPAPAAARLLRPVAEPAAEELAGIGYAGMAIVTLAFRAADLPARPEGSGFLVSPREGLTIKAATCSSVKWPWLAEELRAAHPGEELVVVRCSIGRAGEERALRRSDEELAAAARADLATVCGGPVGAPVEQRITRWETGLPQYDTGHGARVARARQALAVHPSLALCGAAYDGVGIPACIAGATRAVEGLAVGPAAGGRPGAAR